ncbi:SAM-dependent methyltransferase [Streptomyces sp. NPDC006662]|uniref:SAM-dependent methyltransferase n=1 Tax=Streptomyces sp. NPDC006662 TaxID=3156902 RepID=UPI00340A34CC
MAVVRLVGAGIFPQRDLSIGGREALMNASKVLYVNFPGAREWLRELGLAHVEDIAGRYKDGAQDRANYTSMLDAVVSAAREFGDVTYLMQGHPNLGVTLTQEIFRLADDEDDLRVEVIPGISSLDTMMLDLRMDMLERGCTVVCANRLLLFRYHLDPRLGMFIYHGSSVGTSKTNFIEPWQTNQIDLLQDYLCEGLGEDRPFVAVCSQSQEGQESKLVHGKLSGLAAAIKDIDYGTSLFIPPSEGVGDLDRDFLARLLGEQPAVAV